MQLLEILHIENQKERQSKLKELFEQSIQEFQDYKRLIAKVKGESKNHKLDLLKSLLSFKPKNIRLNKLVVENFIHLDELDLAKKQIDLLSKNEKHKDQLHFQTALYLKKKGKTEEALKYYKKSLEFDLSRKQKLSALLHLCQDQLKQNNLAKAKIYLDELIEGWPNQTQVHLKDIQYLKKSNQDTKTKLEKYLKSNKENVFLRIEYLQALIRDGEIEKAEDFLTETKELKLDHLSFYLLEGSVLKVSERHEEALEILKQASRKYPTEYQAFLRYAELAYSLGEIKIALDMVARLKKDHPNQLVIHKREIEMLYKIGHISKAKSSLAKTKSSFPNQHKEFLFLEVDLETKDGNYKKAKELLASIQENQSNQHYKKLIAEGNLHFFNYEFDEAIISFEKARELFGNKPMIWRRLAAAYLSKGDIEKSFLSLQDATKEMAQQPNKKNKVIIPLKSHVATILNDIRLNRSAFEKIFKALKNENINGFKEVMTKEPNYFGSSLYFCIHLRKTGILEKVAKAKKKKPVIKIPKIIIQYWDQPNAPKQIKYVTDTWKRLNKDFEYNFFNKKTAFEFIKKHYGKVELNAFLNCTHPAMESDYFRLAFLNVKGGFYIDIDDACKTNLNDLIDQDYEFILTQEDMGTIANNFMGFIPNHLIVNNAFKQATANLTEYFNEGPWFKTGPGLVTQSFAHTIIKNEKDLLNQDIRFKVLSQKELSEYLYQHLQLPYKNTNKGWFTKAYGTKQK